MADGTLARTGVSFLADEWEKKESELGQDHSPTASDGNTQS